MSNQPIEFVYNTHRIAQLLNIGRSTVNRYCRSLESAGYEFLKDNGYRSFTEHDLSAFRALTELLARGMNYDTAIQTITEKYQRNNSQEVDSVSLAVAAHHLSDPTRQEVAILNQKVDELIGAVAQLSSRIDQIIDERVQGEVAAASQLLNEQVQNVVRQVQAAQEKTNQKLDEMLSRIETHGKRKKFLGLF